MTLGFFNSATSLLSTSTGLTFLYVSRILNEDEILATGGRLHPSRKPKPLGFNVRSYLELFLGYLNQDFKEKIKGDQVKYIDIYYIMKYWINIYF